MWIEMMKGIGVIFTFKVILRMEDVDWNRTNGEKVGWKNVILRMEDVDWNC